MGRLREIVSAENVAADDEALRLISRRADGSMRDSQSLLEQVISFGDGPITAQTVHLMLGTADDARLHELAQVLASGKAGDALVLVDRAANEGIAAGQFTEQLLGYFRDLIAVTVGCPPEMQRHTSEALHDELRALGVTWGIERLLAIVGMIDQTLVRIRHTVHGRVLLEATLVQICHLPDLQSLADMAAALASGSNAMGNGGATNVTQAERPRIQATPLKRSPDRDEKKNVELKLPALATTNGQSTSVDREVRVDQPSPHPPQGMNRVPSAQTAALAETVIKPKIPQRTTASEPEVQMEIPKAVPRFMPTATGVVSSPVAAKSRVQKIRDMEANAYVKRCLEMFDGEIIRIDLPRSEVRSSELSVTDAQDDELANELS